MEFGIFVQGHTPKARTEREGPAAEHNALLNETDLVRQADQHNFKYAWVTEHHFLSEYSHLSASDAYMGYLAAITEQIHLGSGIFSLNPKKDHPVRVAERVAMLDHLSEGRFEFGTGRGAGSREVTGFDTESTDATRPLWDEAIREIPKMWETEEYTIAGDTFNVPYPGDRFPTRNVLPKPFSRPHPPIWVAAGNPPTFEKAARMGIGVLAFTTRAIPEMAPLIATYKDHIDEAEPVGRFVNDNVMITTGMVCAEDPTEARQRAARMGVMYLQSLVYYYHDTIPPPPGAIIWPDPVPEMTVEMVQWQIDNHFLLCGTPDEIIGQLSQWQDIGIDQLVFGVPCDLGWEDTADSLRLFGDHVIPEFDKDPLHRTTAQREAAVGVPAQRRDRAS